MSAMTDSMATQNAPARNAPAQNAIEAKGLTKVYRGRKGGPGKTALKAVDLAVPRGSIVGLLGPNGAGKSTFINILAGMVVKTAGTVSIWGFDIDRNPRQSRFSIGIVPQELNIDPFFTPRESLELQAGLYGVPARDRRTDQILAAVGLADKGDAYARTLSGGMRRRLLVAKALVHRPPVLVLDEPTAGVDIELRQMLWAHIRDLHAQGTTIVLTTHYLEEAQELCDRIAIINHGAVVADEPTPQLLRRIEAKRVLVTPDDALTAVPAGLKGAEILRDGRLAVNYVPSAERFEAVLARIRAAGVTIRDLSTEEADLEDIFLSLTGGAHADGD